MRRAGLAVLLAALTCAHGAAEPPPLPSGATGLEAELCAGRTVTDVTGQSNILTVPAALYGSTGQPEAYLCVPPKLQPQAAVAHCTFDLSWEELLEHEDRLTTGGLGKLMIEEQFEVWVCDSAPPCLAGAGQTGAVVCYTYSEEYSIFVPWGLWENVLGAGHDGVGGDGAGGESGADLNRDAPPVSFRRASGAEELSKALGGDEALPPMGASMIWGGRDLPAWSPNFPADYCTCEAVGVVVGRAGWRVCFGTGCTPSRVRVCARVHTRTPTHTRTPALSRR